MSYLFAQPDFLSRRALTVTGILALHVLAAYVLATGMLHTAVQDDTPPIISSFSPDIPTVPPEPGVPRLDLSGAPRVPQPPAPTLPVAEVELPPATPGPTTLTDLGGPANGAASIPQPLEVIGRNQLPDTQSYYPPQLIRDGIQGASLVRVCVDARGARRLDPTLLESSGNAQLDAGALNVARHGQFARAVQGGVPVPNCYQFRINFRILH